jgi:hypothetical protein
MRSYLRLVRLTTAMPRLLSRPLSGLLPDAGGRHRRWSSSRSRLMMRCRATCSRPTTKAGFRSRSNCRRAPRWPIPTAPPRRCGRPSRRAGDRERHRDRRHLAPGRPWRCGGPTWSCCWNARRQRWNASSSTSPAPAGLRATGCPSRKATAGPCPRTRSRPRCSAAWPWSPTSAPSSWAAPVPVAGPCPTTSCRTTNDLNAAVAIIEEALANETAVQRLDRRHPAAARDPDHPAAGRGRAAGHHHPGHRPRCASPPSATSDAALAKLSIDNRLIPVRVQVERHLARNLDRIAALKLMTANGAMVPLSAVADIRVAEGPPDQAAEPRTRRHRRRRPAGRRGAGHRHPAVRRGGLRQCPGHRALALPASVIVKPSGDAEVQAELVQLSAMR